MSSYPCKHQDTQDQNLAESNESNNRASPVSQLTSLEANEEIAVVVAINGDVVEPLVETTEIQTSIYGSFSLAGTEFALSAQSIQEVVNEPECYSSIPLAPAYLLGVFNLRGSIVPVIDLRAIFLLDSSDDAVAEVRKVAIIEYGELCLGLLFDSTGEVFNANEVEKCLFDSQGNTEADQVISGVFKMKGGSRIVQILDVPGMLKLDKVPKSQNHAGLLSVRKRGKRRQCISFRIGKSCCALDIGEIREIVNIGHIDNKVLAGDLCLGAFDIRGDTVPIVNFSAMLGYATAIPETLVESDSHRVIVMNVQDNLVGLLVDSIEDIIGYFDDELIEFPVLVDRKRAMFHGCIPAKTDSDHAILLKHNEILSSEELEQITKGHSQLFNDSKENLIREKKGTLDRKTLLTFSLTHRFGLNIRDVKEVIDYPSDLIKTPNMAEHIRGMANLRGELVAVIDSRILYNLDQVGCEKESKVLIYEKAGVKQGLVVDSVDSIVPFSRADVTTVPRMLFKAIDGDIDKDVKEAIIIKIAGVEETVCILDLDAVSKRAGADANDSSNTESRVGTTD